MWLIHSLLFVITSLLIVVLFLAITHIFLPVLYLAYDSHYVLWLVVGFVADLRVSQSSVVPKCLHGSRTDVEHLTHVLRIEPLAHGFVHAALTDSIHAFQEFLQLGIKIAECLFFKYDKSHSHLLFFELILAKVQLLGTSRLRVQR